MLGILTGFVDHLRESGVPVSMVEAIDAGEGIEHIDLADRGALKALLGATLVKTERHYAAFDAAFEAYFALAGPAPGSDEDQERAVEAARMVAGGGGGGGAGDEGSDALMAALVRALAVADDALLAAVVRASVDRLAGIEPGRPVGGAYYLYRVMRQLEVDRLSAEMAQQAAADVDDPMGERLAADEVRRVFERFRRMVEAEIRRRLVADRGARAVARTLRRPLIEDVDLSAATRHELAEVERLVHPLGRRLATRLSQRRSRGDRGRLDVRRTMRSSLSTGGAPADPRFRKRRPGRPEIVLLCDVSGSVATFARFTMQLVYAIASQFSGVRTFAFIDGIDEVTAMLGPGSDFVTALDRISREAEVVWLDGHSDYGAAFVGFTDRYLDEVISPRSTVVVTGDARTNYHDPRTDALASIARRARGVYWLNPEPHRYWDTGDSVMGAYSPWCAEVVEVRTLRHLERFVERVALPPVRTAAAPA